MSKVSKKNTVYLFDSEKGGVGKSTFCKAFIQYLIDQKVDFTLIETDLSNRDVIKAYSDIDNDVAEISVDERRGNEADKIFEAATRKNVVVNFPANIATAFDEWLSSTGVLDMQKSQGIRFVKFFMVTQDPSSIQSLEASLKAWGEKIQHVVVQNLDAALEEKYEEIFDDAKLSNLLKRYDVPVIQMERFSYSARDVVNQLELRLDEATESEHVGVLDQQRVKTWLKSCYEQIEHSGVVSAGVSQPEKKEPVKSK